MTTSYRFTLPILCVALSAGCQMINSDDRVPSVSPAAISFATDCMQPPPDTSLPNPCDPAWQLGLYPGDYASFDAELDAGEQGAVEKFETLLYGDAQAPVGS